VLAPEREEDVLHDLTGRVGASELVVREAPESFVVLPEDRLERTLITGANGGHHPGVTRGLTAVIEVNVGVRCHGPSGWTSREDD
jgi:hypothetical protein